ncbi:glycine-rich domain-containing protein [Streptomyces sp. NPDC101115]|uniref:glycine-rich domain-containing protein n=1 Tax=Streptomyces sp. NPDC101115 TaxID=3366106 RepID=UPI003800778C
MSTTHVELQSSARHLLTDDGFADVVHLVMRDTDGIEQPLAERIVDEALKFVATAASGAGTGMRPSQLVDIGWHALILHTRTYEALCQKVGRFVHHVPEGPSTLRRDEITIDRTVAAIRAAGFKPDMYLWSPIADTELQLTDCMHTECHDGGTGCAAPE